MGFNFLIETTFSQNRVFKENPEGCETLNLPNPQPFILP